jgi:hypothetical protein
MSWGLVGTTTRVHTHTHIHTHTHTQKPKGIRKEYPQPENLPRAPFSLFIALQKMPLLRELSCIVQYIVDITKPDLLSCVHSFSLLAIALYISAQSCKVSHKTHIQEPHAHHASLGCCQSLPRIPNSCSALTRYVAPS